MLRRFLFFASALVLSCSSDPPGRPPPGSSGSPFVPPGGAGGNNDGGNGEGGATDAGTCTMLANTGFVVDQVGFVGDPPVGQGGQIQDGVYDLNEARLYVGTGNP